MTIFKKRILQCLAFLAVLYIVLLIPDRKDPGPIVTATAKPFAWNKDKLWQQLENDFQKAKQVQPAQLDSIIQSLKIIAERDLVSIRQEDILVTDSNFSKVENIFFALAPFIAVRQGELLWYTDYYNRARNLIKQQSRHWNVTEATTRNTGL